MGESTIINNGSHARCDDCTNCLLMDFGYSNWTVEGTTVICMQYLHPEPEFDRWYGDDKRLKFAERCPGYQQGEPDCMDVDGEEWDALSDRAKRFIAAQRGVPYGKELP